MTRRKVSLAGLGLIWVLAFGVGIFGLTRIAAASTGVACHRWVIRNNENLTFHHVNCEGLDCTQPCECYSGVHYHKGKEYTYCVCLPSTHCSGLIWDCEPASNPVTNKVACRDEACSPKSCATFWTTYNWQELGHPEPPPEWGQDTDYLTCPCN